MVDDVDDDLEDRRPEADRARAPDHEPRPPVFENDRRRHHARQPACRRTRRDRPGSGPPPQACCSGGCRSRARHPGPAAGRGRERRGVPARVHDADVRRRRQPGRLGRDPAHAVPRAGARPLRRLVREQAGRQARRGSGRCGNRRRARSCASRITSASAAIACGAPGGSGLAQPVEHAEREGDQEAARPRAAGSRRTRYRR